MKLRTTPLSPPGSPPSPQVLLVEAMGLMIVADSPATTDDGRAAVQIALRATQNHLTQNGDVLTRFKSYPTPDLRNRVLATIDEAVARASQEVFAFARRRKGVMVALDVVALLGNEAFVGHVGDGRVYLVRRGIVHQLTVDHRQEESDDDAPREDGDLPPIARRLTRALGPRPKVRVENLCMELADGDRFAILTRSLHDSLSDGDVQEALVHGPMTHFAQRVRALSADAPMVGAAATVGDPVASDAGHLRLNILKPMPLFAHCSEAELRQVARATHPRRFRRGAHLFHQGDDGGELFLLISGRVRIERDGQHIVTLGPGSNFGEMAMLDEPKRSASAVAEDPAELLVIHKDAFFKLLRANSALAVKILWNMLLSLSSSLRRTSAKLAEAQEDRAVPRPPTADQPLDAFDLMDDVDTVYNEP